MTVLDWVCSLVLCGRLYACFMLTRGVGNGKGLNVVSSIVPICDLNWGDFYCGGGSGRAYMYACMYFVVLDLGGNLV